jgi:predicted amidohydrolase
MVNDRVRLSVVQFKPEFEAKEHNLKKISSLLQNLETDIILLPELCTTGYSFLNRQESLAVAEDIDGSTAGFFLNLSAKLGAAIIAGFVERSGDKVFNSAIIAMPDSRIQVYRKTHLFFKEKICFDPGDTGFFSVRHPSKDCRIGVMICNDWRYPEAARTLALQGVDLIVCPANLVSHQWSIAMPARALENKVWLAVANRYGTETRILEDGSPQTLAFNGNSAIYDYEGSAVAKAEKENKTVLTVMMDPLKTRDKSFNDYNDLFNDRRPDLYYKD